MGKFQEWTVLVLCFMNSDGSKSYEWYYLNRINIIFRMLGFKLFLLSYFIRLNETVLKEISQQNSASFLKIYYKKSVILWGFDEFGNFLLNLK